MVTLKPTATFADVVHCLAEHKVWSYCEGDKCCSGGGGCGAFLHVVLMMLMMMLVLRLNMVLRIVLVI
jgi:hypothetical protein